jgi:predicted amidohydrolase
MRIALGQVRSGTDPAVNLEMVDDYSRRAADAGAALVVFPEATMCRFGVPLAPVAEPLDGPWAGAVRSIAASAGLVVVAGMFTPTADGRVTNTLIATGPGIDTHYQLPQDPPLRRVRVHRVAHRRSWPRACRHRCRRGRRGPDDVL